MISDGAGELSSVLLESCGAEFAPAYALDRISHFIQTNSEIEEGMVVIMQEYKKQFIEFAVQTGALKFGEFTLKSGRISPYFFNAGEFKTGEQLSKLAEYYADCYNENIALDNVVLFGPAYKGIPLVAITAVKLADKYEKSLPICYNRKEAKDHGEGGMTVGAKMDESVNVVVIEDVITAGTAIGETKEVLKASGNAKIAGVIIAVDRMERRTDEATETTLQEIARTQGVKIFSVVTIKEIAEHLHNRKVDGKVYIGDVEKARIDEYLEKYGI